MAELFVALARQTLDAAHNHVLEELFVALARQTLDAAHNHVPHVRGTFYQRSTN